MPFVSPRRLTPVGLLALAIACSPDATEPADSIVSTDTADAAVVTVTQDSVADDGVVTLVLKVRSTQSISSLQGSLHFPAGALEFVSKSTPEGDGSYMLNAATFSEGRVAFAAFTPGSFERLGAGAEVMRIRVRTAGAFDPAAIDASLDVVGGENGAALRASGRRGSVVAPRTDSECALPTRLWGDANGDDAVSIPDAQQIARFAAGLPMQNLDALKARGDVNGNGVVDIMDAQQIARFSIGLSAAERINSPIPVHAASLTVEPEAPMIRAGLEKQLSALPRDAENADIRGCVATSWVSSDSRIATVDGNGLVNAVSPGVAAITVSSGGQMRRVKVTVTATSTTTRR